MSSVADVIPKASQLVETPDTSGAYPRLSDHQIATLEVGGSRRAVRRGEFLIREGYRSDDFFVILRGMAAIMVNDETGAPQLIRVHGRRRFLGELAELEGQASFFTAAMAEDGEVLVVPVKQVRRLVEHDQDLSDLILRAYLLRRSLLIEDAPGLRIIGSCYSPDTARLREFAARNRLPHRWLDLDRDRNAERLVRHFGLSTEQTPVVILGDQVLRNPTNSELARLVGLPVADIAIQEWDVVIVGAGPAGLAAAVYGASDGLMTTALELTAVGGQAGTSSRIENYLGFPAGISGSDLAERAALQADKFAARIAISAEAIALQSEGGRHVIRLADDACLDCRAVVLATGARYRMLSVPGIERFQGNGVYYAATHQEALMCGAGAVVVVGGGNSAGQATVFLASRGNPVHLLVRSDDLGKSMSRYLVDQVEQDPRVSVHLHTEVREACGDDQLEFIVAEDNRTGRRFQINTRSLFVFIGAVPNTAWLRGVVTLDDHGFISTGADALYPGDDRQQSTSRRRPLPLETSRPGVFAAGDVRSRSVKRVASAVGEGSMTIRQINDYLSL
ncbi:FAD-dependent oxidoreductase [Mycobacterium sp. M23085]|uniref:FAD-dependent oxidoreductase n=1 Tax=Mycobacterium sp. M23085 TaxID=3378087 RepID=UPI003877F906